MTALYKTILLSPTFLFTNNVYNIYKVIFSVPSESQYPIGLLLFIKYYMYHGLYQLINLYTRIRRKRLFKQDKWWNIYMF